MFITGIYEIINVWANDADKLTVIVGIVSFPLLLYFIFSFNRITNIKELIYKENRSNKISSIILRIIFIFIFISFILGMVGVGQVILIPILDAFIRGIGIIIYLNGISLLFVLINLVNKSVANNRLNLKEIDFYKEARYPEYLFLFMIAFGSSLLTLSFSGIILTIFVLLPFIILKVKKEEKILMNIDNSYYNYAIDIPMLFPDIIKIIKKAFLKEFGN